MDREEIIKFLQASMETEIDGSSAEVCDILFVIIEIQPSYIS
jgi:hypothetical protein